MKIRVTLVAREKGRTDLFYLWLIALFEVSPQYSHAVVMAMCIRVIIKSMRSGAYVS